MTDKQQIAYELAAVEERILQSEREIELLGWLPTAASWGAIDQLGRERARHAWLLRVYWGWAAPASRPHEQETP